MENSKITNIVIAGASTYGVKNMGDDAMFKNLVDCLKRKNPEVNINFCRDIQMKISTIFLELIP